jgi:hypothetical protein
VNAAREREALWPYGYIPGTCPNVWCVTCGCLHTLDASAFKCRNCAIAQMREVERILEQAGPLPANPVPVSQ